LNFSEDAVHPAGKQERAKERRKFREIGTCIVEGREEWRKRALASKWSNGNSSAETALLSNVRGVRKGQRDPTTVKERDDWRRQIGKRWRKKEGRARD